jgi:hypothetical protein
VSSPLPVTPAPSSDLHRLHSGRAKRWPGQRISSVAAITRLLTDTVSGLGLRVNGPLTSVVLCSQVDGPDEQLALRQVHAWVETDRRDDRRDGWTEDRVGLAGRWVVVNDAVGSYAYGLPGGGPIDSQHMVWRSALAGRNPTELDVRAWQRVDRTSWVLHDGDGMVMGEFVVDEQRQMGTQESSVDVRLMTGSHEQVFVAVADAVEVFCGRPAAAVVDLTTDHPDSAVDFHAVVESAEPVAARALNEIAGPAALWVIRAAIDVETLARSNADPTDRAIKSLGLLIGSGPFLVAAHYEAAEQLQPMLADAIAAHRYLSKRAYQQWAEKKVLSHAAAKTGRHSASDAWPLDELVIDDHESEAVGHRGVLSSHVAELRGLVLLLLEEDPSSLGSLVLVEVLRDALGGWLGGPRSLPKVIDSRRVVAVRCAIAAVLAASEAEQAAVASKALRQRLSQLDTDLRWIGRRVALVETISRTAAASGLTPGSMLTPEVWMDLGVLSRKTQRRMTKRLARARRQATRLFRDLSDAV